MKALKEPIHIQTNCFKKISLDFLYFEDTEKYNSLYGSLLIRILLKKTKEYNTIEKFYNAIIKNYVMSMQISKGNMGKNRVIKIHVTIPDNTILKDNNYDYQKTIAFIINSIYQPLTKENAFNIEDVENAKKELKDYINRQLKNITSYASIRTEELLDLEGNVLGDNIMKHREEIDLITEEDLYKFYEEVIKTKYPFIFILGNVKEDFKKQLCSLLDINLTPSNIKESYITPFTKVAKEQFIEESGDYSQSILKFAYKISNYTWEDRTKLYMIHSLLNASSSNILFEYLRTKENLVYTTHSSSYIDNGVLIITAQISRNTKEKAMDTIRMIMEKMRNEEFIKERLENCKEQKRINLERQKDSSTSLINDQIDSYFQYNKTLKEEYDEIKKFTAKDITDFVERMQLDTIYYLEGRSGK